MPKTIDIDAAIATEARSRGITTKELLREKARMVTIHTRLPASVIAEIDAEARKEKTTRAAIFRERCERGSARP